MSEREATAGWRAPAPGGGQWDDNERPMACPAEPGTRAQTPDQPDGGIVREPVARFVVGANERQSLGPMADLRYVYASHVRGWEYNRPCPVIVEPAAFLHKAQIDAARPAFIGERSDLVVKAIEEPEIVYREPRRLENGHFSQLLAVADPKDPQHYLAVVLSLANLPGEPRSEFHLVTTVYPARRRYFFRTLANGHLELKQRWKLTARQRAGT